MSVSLTGGQAAGGQAGGAAPPPATGAAPDGGAQLPEWLKTIDDAELKADTTLHRYADVASLAKSHVHAQRMVGRDKIPLPGKDASPEDWKRVFNKLGLPEAPDLYKLQKPEGAELSDEFLGSVAKKAFELNILPHQAQELVAWLVKEEAEAAKQAGQSDDDAKQAAWGELQKEWGQGYDKEVRKAQQGAPVQQQSDKPDDEDDDDEEEDDPRMAASAAAHPLAALGVFFGFL